MKSRFKSTCCENALDGPSVQITLCELTRVTAMYTSSPVRNIATEQPGRREPGLW